jgi:adenylate kinase family enzyme
MSCFVRRQVDHAAEEAAAQQLDKDRSIARVVVEDYLDCEGEFKRPGQGGEPGLPIGFNLPLGVAVSDLVSTVTPKVLPGDLPDLPFPLRLAVVGAPFSGKTTVAQDLAKRFKLQLLDVEELVQRAVKAAEQYVAPEPIPAAPKAPAVDAPVPEEEEDPEAAAVAEAAAAAEAEAATPRLVKLGRRAASCLAEGQALPDDLLVGVLVQAMQDAAKYTPPPELDAKGKPIPPPKPAAKGAPPPELPPPQGFVVDGFPRTVDQSEMLERALTGLDLAAEARRVAEASRLAPPPPGALPEVSRPLRSGLDAVLVLGLTDEAAALKRALGRRLDPQTGKIWHLEFDPPPSNDPGLNARLVEVQDASNDAVQIQRRLTAYVGQAAALDGWLKRFIKVGRRRCLPALLRSSPPFLSCLPPHIALALTTHRHLIPASRRLPFAGAPPH